ncbi:Aldo/keto reductase family-domain-containing protein [Apodospora peruviana]|uniref:Aldo/keto reductase family-domain-containing protein n=1 Tax=Apodospora peruviana TaxID=516989 RepID=A0AAE0I1C3_9PEZI|nr:Aldo/keto reductase family-domain-containing protein [Apodospora peruviana]
MTSKATAARPPLNTVLPPLILGTATFNKQYVDDPESMPYRDIVARAISLGVNSFDTSPYYGPSEILLGKALDALMNPRPSGEPTPAPLPRSAFTIVTKAGRVVLDEFDYSPAYIRYSVLRSLQRLHTPYLDLVYTHDVEFVPPAEVLGAVRELRRLRDEDGLIRYVGISGFPVDVLCSLAEMILAETGEPLDAVLSYGHFTIQNRRLGLPLVEGGDDDENSPLARLRAAGVGVVLNASMLGMGLLTSRGIPTDPVTPEGEASPLVKWHPSPSGLRVACKELTTIAAAAGERLESVAIRWAMEEWARVGASAGVGVTIAAAGRVGGTVCGVSSIAELEETVKEWREVLSGLEQKALDDREASGTVRRRKVLELVQKQLWPALGSWKDYVWASPGAGFVNSRPVEDQGKFPDDGVMSCYEQLKKNARGSWPGSERR